MHRRGTCAMWPPSGSALAPPASSSAPAASGACSRAAAEGKTLDGARHWASGSSSTATASPSRALQGKFDPGLYGVAK